MKQKYPEINDFSLLETSFLRQVHDSVTSPLRSSYMRKQYFKNNFNYIETQKINIKD